jgi:thiamine-phosphate pyrophosphorylase
LHRVIDANLNRAREGLRLLEDLARFLLNDEDLAARLKGLRQRLAVADPAAARALLSARDAAGDRAAFLESEAEGRREDLLSLLQANAKRAQESLRVLEETSKLEGLEPGTFKRLRFELYDLEKELASRLLRRERAARIKGLYLILDGQALGDRDPIQVARQAIAGGARLLQLRDKERDKRELLPLAQQLRALCQETGVLFLINDHLDLALAAAADGVHLGQKDLPVAVARRLLPIESLVGCSTNNPAEARRAQGEGADYVAVGAIYPTASKDDSRPASLQVLRSVKEAVQIPVVAIGGITRYNVAETVAAGADAVAVISAVVGTADPEAAARELVEAMGQPDG